LSWFFGSDEWRVALTVLAIEGGISDSVEILVKKAEDILHTVFFLNIQLVIGVEEILMKLIEMGIKIGLVSNGPKSRQQKNWKKLS
jgi:FMN phosphatase YigB (HAD superfamily)